MEFSEKLQELRKNKGLTQEELAEALYVSRTAISKWESGRGYPSIDSLKEISKFFSVTIDDLLSSEKVVYIAEKENKSNIQKLCDLIFGITDMLSILLIILPLYPKMMNNYIYSVPLFEVSELTSFNRIICWIAFIMLVLIGLMKVILDQRKVAKGQNLIMNISNVISVGTVVLLALTRQTYAIVIAFLLLMVKVLLIFKKHNIV